MIVGAGGRSSVVEHNLAKVGVEGSNPFARSNVFNENKRLSLKLLAALFAIDRPEDRRKIPANFSGMTAPCPHDRPTNAPATRRTMRRYVIGGPSAPAPGSDQAL